MHGFSLRARRLLGAAAVSMAAVATVLGATSASIAESPVPPAVTGKLVAGSNLSRIYSDSAARQPVIVQFAMPALADSASFASPADADAAQTRAIHSAQDAILGDFLGGSAEIAKAEASADLNIKRMDFSPVFGINVTAAELAQLAADPKVTGIQEDGVAAPTLIDSLPLIQMPDVYLAGGTGVNYHVAVLDTGARRSHEFLSSRITHAACFGTTNASFQSTSYCPGGASSSTDIDSANDCNEATIEGCGHGTHTNGTVAGFNTSPQAGEPANGVARDARLININVFSRFALAGGNCGSGATQDCVLTFNTDQIRGLEHVYSLRNTLNIAAASMSLGGGAFSAACDGDSRKAIIDQLKAANIATVIAAGNDGLNTQVGAPGCISTAITVASSTKADARSSFSNWGNLIDVVAPGSNILASYLNGSSNTFYSSLSGTSMATPHVAGAWAALRSVRPTATVDQIEAALESTGLGITSASVTKPRIRVNNALGALPGGGTPNLLSAVAPVARSTQVGNTVTAFATIINAGTATGTACSIAVPGGNPLNFTYRTRSSGGALGPVNTPVDIAGGNTAQGFVMAFTPTAAMSANLALVFDCTNSAPAPSVVGLNTFLMTATTTPIADMIATAATTSGDGILNVPLGGQHAAAFASINIGATATLEARVSANSIGASGATLAGTMLICRSNNAAVCQEPLAPTSTFNVANGGTVTFNALFISNGTAIPFDPANKRLFVNFFQGATGVGSTSVAVRTTGSPEVSASAN